MGWHGGQDEGRMMDHMEMGLDEGWSGMRDGMGMGYGMGMG